MLGVVAVVPVVVPLVGPPSWAAFAWAYQVLKYYLSTRYEGTKAQAHRHRHTGTQAHKHTDTQPHMHTGTRCNPALQSTLK